ncbi:MAG: hypothetical protein ISQ34_00685 [Rickettsiales bacterium]|nr:hypothetical protein [Rickettsiales bacterium]
MSKILELVMISVLLLSAFFFGVGYSGPVKENFGWLFEVKEQEVDILETNTEQNIAKPIIIEKKVEITEDAQETDSPELEEFGEID